jgi:chromate reductase
MASKVAVFVGSLRKAAWSGKVAHAIISLAPSSLQLEIVEIRHLPLYNQDSDDGGNPPRAFTAFRQELKKFDAVLFVTPEHNRSVPAALKNAIDVGSRPYGQSVWDGKPGAVVSVSPGAIGGFGANHHLRQSLVFLNVPCLQMPEAYIGSVAGKFDDQGALSDNRTRELLQQFMTAYAGWVERNAARS